MFVGCCGEIAITMNVWDRSGGREKKPWLLQKGGLMSYNTGSSVRSTLVVLC